jgi:thioredoxin
MEHLTKETFLTKVFDYENKQEWEFTGERPCIIDFYADWCAPCRMLSPLLDQLARETPEAKIVKVNVDQSPDIASRHKVNSIPMLILFDEGKPKAQIVGLAPKQAIQRMLATGAE